MNQDFIIKDIVSDKTHELKSVINSDGFSVVWNTGDVAKFVIDNKVINSKKNDVIYLTENNHVDLIKFTSIRLIHFSYTFYHYCIKNVNLGFKGLLSFWELGAPQIQLKEEILFLYQWLWEYIEMEMKLEMNYRLEVLQNALGLLLMVTTRAFENQNVLVIDNKFAPYIISRYNYLVEKHFRELTRVTEYAKLLNIAPKSLSNTFGKHNSETPSEILRKRRQLEAIRLLENTSKSIKEISNELNFSDVYAFSRFFKKNTGVPPSYLRNGKRSGIEISFSCNKK